MGAHVGRRGRSTTALIDAGGHQFDRASVDMVSMSRVLSAWEPDLVVLTAFSGVDTAQTWKMKGIMLRNTLWESQVMAHEIPVIRVGLQVLVQEFGTGMHKIADACPDSRPDIRKRTALAAALYAVLAGLISTMSVPESLTAITHGVPS